MAFEAITTQEQFDAAISERLRREREKLEKQYSGFETFKEKGIVMDAGGFVHPTFLYESLWCLIGFGVLYLILKKFRKFSGQIFLCYGVWYGIGRTIFEGLRTDSLYIGNTTIRVSQALSAAVVVVFGVLLVVLLRKFIKNPQPIEGVDFFPASSKKSEEIEEEIKEPDKEEVNAEPIITVDNYTSDVAKNAPTREVVTVIDGSRLTMVAYRAYGHKAFWVYVYDANRDKLKNPSAVEKGMELRIPVLPKSLVNSKDKRCLDKAYELARIYDK